MGAHHHHHGCSHDHGHHHHAPASYDRAFAVGIGLNAVYVCFGIYAGFATQSLALMADAWHNLGDVLSLVLAWGAVWLTRRPPSQKRTYGFGRSSIFAALANAVLLLVAAAGIAWGAVMRFGNPVPIQTGAVMIVAAVGILINGGTALMFMRGGKNDINIRGAFLHMAFDAGLSLGVVVAAFLVGQTGWLWIDPVMSLVIVAFIAGESVRMLRDSVELTLDSVPSGIDRAAVEAYLRGLSGVTAVHDLHIWPLSTTSVALTAHLIVPGGNTDDAWLFAATKALKDKFGIDHATLQVERGVAECSLASDTVI